MHDQAKQVRRLVTYEMLTLLLATPIFLFLVPRHIGLYAGLAFLFLVYVLATTRFTRDAVWQTANTQAGHSWFWVSVVSLPCVIAFLVYGYLQGHSFVLLHMLIITLLYCAWAWVQQTLFQFYFLGRLFVLLPAWPVWVICLLGGAAYGLVHLPEYAVVLLTIPAGCCWSYLYWRDRAILPLAASHALLAMAYYYGIRGEDLYPLWFGEALSGALR